MRRFHPFLILFFVYLAALAGSHYWTARLRLLREPATTRPGLEVTADGETLLLSYQDWKPEGGAAPGKLPVLFLHGSPSSGSDDGAALARELVKRGHRVLSVDRPGYGESAAWAKDYSMEHQAALMLALLDKLKVPRAHAVAWSFSGGIALHMKNQAPDKVPSLTLLSAIGLQEGEGSGSYLFEHGKYAVAWLGTLALPELIPHYGALGTRAERSAFVCEFWESDQRKLRPILENLKDPVLIIHGMHDPLVPAWLAVRHHEMLAQSRLVMLDDSHFYPLGYGKEDSLAISAEEISQLADEHWRDRFVPETRNLAEGYEASAPIFGGLIKRGYHFWILSVFICAVLTLFFGGYGTLVTAVLTAFGYLDLGVGIFGALIGALLRRGFLYRSWHWRNLLPGLGAVVTLMAGAAIAGLAHFKWFGPYPSTASVSVSWLVVAALFTLPWQIHRLWRGGHHQRNRRLKLPPTTVTPGS